MIMDWLAIFRRSGFARTAAGFSGAVTGLLILVLLGVYLIVAQLIHQKARGALAADMASFAEIYTQRLLPGLREAVERRAAAAEPSDIFLLIGRQGEVLAGNLSTLPTELRGLTGAISFGEAGAFLGEARELRGGFRLVIGHDRTPDQTLLRKLAVLLSVLGLVVAATGALGGYLLGVAALSQVALLDEVLRKAQAGDLSARYPATSGSDEFAAIGVALNHMLDRMQASVEGLKEVSDRVAHEMRTPLAHLRSGLDALRRNSDGQSREKLGELVAETDELIAVFAALLDIATTEAAASNSGGLAPVAIDAVIEDVVELYEAVAEERAVSLLFSECNALHVMGERALLMRMIANIVDNAIKFSPENGVVAIATRAVGGAFEILVRDQGPGLAEEFGDKAFDRFSRGPGAETQPGHGLGLALVRAIAIRHGMKIELRNASPGLEVAVLGQSIDKSCLNAEA